MFDRRWGLHRALPEIFDKPAFLLSQDPDMSYQEMKYRKQRTDFRYRGLVAALAAAIASAAVLALR